jgi:retron-type reverse transcriptase
MHHVTPALLAWAFQQLKPQAAPGIDGVTWEEYAAGLDANIDDLHSRVMRGAYQAKPSRRHYIPKPDGRKRPETGSLRWRIRLSRGQWWKY